MSDQQPFGVEVVIDAPREVTWRALTDPTEIRRWFGWDYEGLDEEIRYIFVDHATRVAPERLELENGQTIELEVDGPRTIVRLTSPGRPSDADREDVYDDIEEGWRAFFQQLRYYLERHAGEDRRTVFLEGVAPPAKVVSALDAVASGRLWHASPHQLAIVLERRSGGLVVVEARNPLDSDTAARMTVTVTTYGLDDSAFNELRREWESWWTSLAQHPRVVPSS